MPTIQELLFDPISGLTLEAEYVHCGPETQVHALQVDSRRITARGAFLAVRGERSDGHDFLESVQASGAALAIIQRGHRPAPGLPHVGLRDTKAALAQICAAFHGWPASQLTLAGITGTNGKTTTAHLVSAVLAHANSAHLRLGTTGNWLVNREQSASFTTPFPLEMQALLARAVSEGASSGVMEVSSHALAQGRVEPIRYTAVGMTSFSQDHLDFHPDMQAYLDAKCRLASRHLRPDGVAVAAVDDHPACRQFLKAAADAGARVWRVSRGAETEAEIFVEGWSMSQAGLRATVRTPAGSLELRSPLVGAFNLDNLLVATGLSLALGMNLSQIREALARCPGAPGRLERVVTAEGIPPGPAVFVDYAHTPDAVQRSIEALRASMNHEERLIVVLGCGGDRDPSKRAPMGDIASHGADTLIATSDNPRREDPEKIIDAMMQGVSLADGHLRRVDRRAAIRLAIESARPSDTVLIAGKGHERVQIVGDRMLPFDDREEALTVLKRSSPLD